MNQRSEDRQDFMDEAKSLCSYPQRLRTVDPDPEPDAINKVVRWIRDINFGDAPIIVSFNGNGENFADSVGFLLRYFPKGRTLVNQQGSTLMVKLDAALRSPHDGAPESAFIGQLFEGFLAEVRRINSKGYLLELKKAIERCPSRVQDGSFMDIAFFMAEGPNSLRELFTAYLHHVFPPSRGTENVYQLLHRFFSCDDPNMFLWLPSYKDLLNQIKFSLYLSRKTPPSV